MTIAELWSDLRYRVRALLRRDNMEAELDAELRDHLERQIDNYVRAGWPRERAERQARIDLGGVEQVKEQSRDARGTVLLESVMQDLRYAARGLRARPAFTLGVALTLGLGIGANTAMFGIVDRLLFRPPPYLKDAGSVNIIYLTYVTDRVQRVNNGTSYARYMDFVRDAQSVSLLAAYNTWSRAIGDGPATRQMQVAGVSATYFQFFDAPPALGRYFTEAEDVAPTGAPVVVLSYPYWQLAYGGRADVLGQQLRMDRTVFTVIGVAPKNFVGVVDEQVPAMFVPITAFLWDARPKDYRHNYGWVGRTIMVRRKPDMSAAAAASELSVVFRRSWAEAQKTAPMGSQNPIESARPSVILAPVQAARAPGAGPEGKVAMWVGGVAFIVLLVACANVANLLLARALTRRREIGLRLALGVSRSRLLRQLGVESLLLALSGGVVSLIIGRAGASIMSTLFLPSGTPFAVATDRRTLAITMLLVLGAALFSGIVPAVHSLRYNLSQSLGAGAREAGGGTHGRLRGALLASQAALSVVLLVGAGLFVRSLLNVRSMHMGYDQSHLLVVTDNMRSIRYDRPHQIAFESGLVDAARTVPGVESATSAPTIPFFGFEGRALFVPGVDSVDALGNFILQAGNPDYFRIMGTRILLGRSFTESDGPNAPRVIVVSAGMANLLWPGQSPLGKCVRIEADTMPCTTVVGVAEDTRMQRLVDAKEFMYYVPLAQYGLPTDMQYIRVSGGASAYVDALRSRLQREMPGDAYVSVQPLQDMIDPQLASWRMGATMFVVFGALALVLAAFGLYSVVSYSVTQRRQELGVRLALGAQPGNIVRLVIRAALSVIIAGVLVGTAAAALSGRWIAMLLFQEPATDPIVFGGVAIVMVLVALIASSGPALLASRLDPNVVLRCD